MKLMESKPNMKITEHATEVRTSKVTKMKTERAPTTRKTGSVRKKKKKRWASAELRQRRARC